MSGLINIIVNKLNENTYTISTVERSIKINDQKSFGNRSPFLTKYDTAIYLGTLKGFFSGYRKPEIRILASQAIEMSLDEYHLYICNQIEKGKFNEYVLSDFIDRLVLGYNARRDSVKDIYHGMKELEMLYIFDLNDVRVKDRSAD